ncbi:PorT family protein [Flavobacterium agricola]|uniref:PorT family protein n=1 Tax=Flavobacterium agricola TaxID=2870839 RepID=A0ABY6LYH9_9FLAO|nr:porin family protein [Flavobacterium agricola]UYW01346.1 PorT family protein [Flavobacterium agricola]
MKKQLTLLLLFIGILAQAQGMFGKNPIINLENFDQKRIHYGFYLGLNSYDFKFDYKDVAEDIEVKSSVGFNVGIIGNLKLTEHLDFRFEPGVSFSSRNLIFPYILDDFDKTREVKSTYINLPFLLKFSAKRTGNIKPYLIGGYSYAMNLSSNYNATDDNYNGKFRMKRGTGNLEAGLGIDIYFEYFKFSPSIRGVFGLDNEIIDDNTPYSPWTGNVTKMQTRGFFINFAFH